MKTLILLAMMQVPQDTIRGEWLFPVPRAEAQPVIVNVENYLSTDSVASILQSGADRSQEALVAAIMEHGCACDGTPDWVYVWGLSLATVAVGALVYHVYKTHAKDESGDWVDVDVDVDIDNHPGRKKHGH